MLLVQIAVFLVRDRVDGRRLSRPPLLACKQVRCASLTGALAPIQVKLAGHRLVRAPLLSANLKLPRFHLHGNTPRSPRKSNILSQKPSEAPIAARSSASEVMVVPLWGSYTDMELCANTDVGRIWVKFTLLWNAPHGCSSVGKGKGDRRPMGVHFTVPLLNSSHLCTINGVAFSLQYRTLFLMQGCLVAGDDDDPGDRRLGVNREWVYGFPVWVEGGSCVVWTPKTRK